MKDVNSPSRWNFRIWDVEKKQWLCENNPDALPYYGFDLRGGEVTAIQGMDWIYKQFFHGKELIWEQSTGLRDKNGKEIYEGDIVKIDQTLDHWIPEIAPVRFDDELLAFTVEDDRDLRMLSDFSEDMFEIVGNIHETKENGVRTENYGDLPEREDNVPNKNESVCGGGENARAREDENASL